MGRSGSGSQRQSLLPLHQVPTNFVSTSLSCIPSSSHRHHRLRSPIELNFFKLLDAELEKVESFYLDREKEMQERTVLLREQLNELNDHRKLFYVGCASFVLGVVPHIPP